MSTSDLDDEPIHLSLEEQARQLVRAWEHSPASAGANFRAFAMSALSGIQREAWEEAIQDAVLENLQAPDVQGHLKQIASVALKTWLERGDIGVPEPSSRVRQLIDAAYWQLDKRPAEFVQAVKEQGVAALALSEARVPIKQIARDLGCSQSLTRRLIADAKAEVAEHCQLLALYGYRCERVPPDVSAFRELMLEADDGKPS